MLSEHQQKKKKKKKVEEYKINKLIEGANL